MSWPPTNEEIRLVNRQAIIQEIVKEADAGEAKHGPFHYPDGTRAGGMRLHRREMSQLSCDRAAREGELTAAKVLEEEVDEVLAEEDKVKLRKELLQVAAVSLKWIEKLDQEDAAANYTVTVSNNCPLVGCKRPFCRGEQDHDIGGERRSDAVREPDLPRILLRSAMPNTRACLQPS